MNDRPDDWTLTDPEWERLARFLSGESDAAEAAEIREWLDADPARAAEIEALRGPMAGLSRDDARADIDVEAALRNVRARLDAGHAGDPSVIPIARRRPWHSPRIRAAAGLAIVLGAALVWRTATLDAPALGLEYATASGERTAFDLPDGTSVVLGPSSRLEVAEDYGSAARTVALAGEAFFVATHDDARPFRVRAGNAVIEDLGTAFLLRALPTGARADAPGVRVVVTEGSVRVEPAGAGAPVVLEAGDRAVLEAGAELRTERGIDPGADVAWTDGRLAFEDAALGRVALDLERWYGIILQVDSALAERRLTATFETDDRSDVLEILGLALGARVDIRADTAVVTPAP